MKKFKNLLLLPLFMILLVPAFLFSACKQSGDNGDGSKKQTPETYTITFSSNLPAGVSAFVYTETKVSKGEDYSFSLKLKPGFDKGTISVAANSATLTEDETHDFETGLELKYTLTNVQENKNITVSGLPELKTSTVNFGWVDYTGVSKIDDKNIADFTISITIESVKPENDKVFNFSSSRFKDVVNNGFNQAVSYGDVLTISISNCDNYTSFVDDLISVDYASYPCTAERICVVKDGAEVSGFKAIYTITIGRDDTDIAINEEAIVRAGDFPKTNCLATIADVDYDILSCPVLKVVDSSGIAIEDYAGLADAAKAGEINIEIVPNSEIWKYILKMGSLRYSINGKNLTYIEEDGKFIFKNVPLPQDMGNFYNYTLKIDNVKEIVSDETKFGTLNLSVNTNYTTFANERIKVAGTEYYCKELEYHVVIEVDNAYSTLEVELLNTDEDKFSTTITLSPEYKKIKDGLSIAEYTNPSSPTPTGKTKYVITFDGTNEFYKTVKYTVK